MSTAIRFQTSKGQQRSQLVDIPRHMRIVTREEEEDVHWTLVPIFVPILVGVIIVALFTVGIVVWYRWKHPSQHNSRHRFKRLFAGVRRIRPKRRDTGWAIDAEEQQSMTRPSFHHRLFSSERSEGDYSDSPSSLRIAARRVGKGLQDGVSGIVRSLPRAPWNPPIVVSQKPQLGFQVDDRDLMHPPSRSRMTFSDTRYNPATSSSGSGSSSGSTGSAPPHELPALFGIEQGSGSAFELVDQTADYHEPAVEETLSLLPRTPTVRSEATDHPSVLLISHHGRDFSLRTKSTVDSRISHPHPTKPQTPAPFSPDDTRQPLLIKNEFRPLPPVPRTSPPIPGVTHSGHDQLIQRPPPTAVPSDLLLCANPGESSKRLRRHSAISLRSIVSIHAASKSTSMLSISIPQGPPTAVSEESTFLASPGSPADSGAPTPITAPSRDHLLRWQASKHFEHDPH